MREFYVVLLVLLVSLFSNSALSGVKEVERTALMSRIDNLRQKLERVSPSGENIAKLELSMNLVAYGESTIAFFLIH